MLSGEGLLEKKFRSPVLLEDPPPMLLEDIEEETEETPFCLEKGRSGETQNYYFEDK